MRHHDSLATHFARRGTVTVLLGRWLPYARTATPLVAGASDMPYRRFAAASIVGSGLWAAAMCTLGYTAYRACVAILLVVRQRARRRFARLAGNEGTQETAPIP